MNDKILILDCGGSYARALARRMRRCGIYCELLPSSSTRDAVVRQNAHGIVLAGDDPQIKPELFTLPLPVLALGESPCRFMVRAVGGQVGEPVLTQAAAPLQVTASPLIGDVQDCDRYFTSLSQLTLPADFTVLATAAGAPAVFGCEEKRLFGAQFEVEANDPEGTAILYNFAVSICGCRDDWAIPAFLEAECRRIRQKVGSGKALMALSGGIDSSVCAAIMDRSIGPNMYYLYVDTGLMRKGDTEMIQRVFGQDMGLNLITVDAGSRFLESLRGVTDPDEKWAVTEKLFSAIFAEEAAKLGQVDFLVQGTIYPDLLNNGLDLSRPEAENTIEPARRLLKEEVRQLAEIMGLPDELVWRQSFPGCGLARRILGEATAQKLSILREADAIYCDELRQARLDKRADHFYAVLEESTSTGDRACRCLIGLRAATRTGGHYLPCRLPYDLLERTSERILAEVPGVSRVVYDTTPSTFVEWE